MLRDTYASESLVKLAESLGFEGEPAHIDGVNGKKDYTLAIIKNWIYLKSKIAVITFLDVIYTSPNSSHDPIFKNDWSYTICIAGESIYQQADRENDKNYTSKQFPTEGEALEDGLLKACMLIKERKNAEVLDR